MATMVRTHLMLPKELLDQMDEFLGPGKRSEKVAQLIENWARLERQRRAIEDLLNSPPSKSPEEPPEWSTPEGVVEWVRAQRRRSSPRSRRIDELNAARIAEAIAAGYE